MLIKISCNMIFVLTQKLIFYLPSTLFLFIIIFVASSTFLLLSWPWSFETHFSAYLSFLIKFQAVSVSA